MMRRDYILEQIEQFAAALANMLGHAQSANWEQASGATGAEFQRLVGVDADGALQLSDTELLARLIQGGPSQIVESKIFMLATLFKMSGDVLAGQGNLEAGDRHYLKGLQLLLYHPGLMALEARPDFVPTVAAFLSALGNSAIPVPTLARLSVTTSRRGNLRRRKMRSSRWRMPGNRAASCPTLEKHFINAS